MSFIRYPEEELWSAELCYYWMCELDYYWILICSKSLQYANLHWVRHGRSPIIVINLLLEYRLRQTADVQFFFFVLAIKLIGVNNRYETTYVIRITTPKLKYNIIIVMLCRRYKLSQSRYNSCYPAWHLCFVFIRHYTLFHQENHPHVSNMWYTIRHWVIGMLNVYVYSSRLQKVIPGLTHKVYVLQRLSFDALSLDIRQSI